MSAPASPPPYGPAILFCPGDRPERFGKALAAADQVILDLEDAVAADGKDRARREVCAALPDLDLDRVIVRVNPLGGRLGQQDLEAIDGTGVRHVMAPKAELAAAPLPGDYDWFALCETPTGVLDAREIAAMPGVRAITWGSEDLAVSLGARVAPGLDPLSLPHLVVARGTMPLAAAAADIPAIDRVYLDLEDDEGLSREARQAVGMGYRGKLALHPRQVPIIRRAFRPSEDELEEAQRVVAAAAQASGRAFALDGHMVDEPLIAQARLIISLAQDGIDHG